MHEYDKANATDELEVEVEEEEEEQIVAFGSCECERGCRILNIGCE